jgi:hypothetical protein
MVRTSPPPREGTWLAPPSVLPPATASLVRLCAPALQGWCAAGCTAEDSQQFQQDVLLRAASPVTAASHSGGRRSSSGPRQARQPALLHHDHSWAAAAPRPPSHDSQQLCRQPVGIAGEERKRQAVAAMARLQRRRPRANNPRQRLLSDARLQVGHLARGSMETPGRSRTSVCNARGSRLC